MVDLFGISLQEAVARVNRHWSQVDADGRVPRVWIVGLDLVYHEGPDYWARRIYYGPNCQWWVPGQEAQAVPARWRRNRFGEARKASDQPSDNALRAGATQTVTLRLR